MVVDASVVLAMIGAEPGGEAAKGRLKGGEALSIVNAGEILGKLVSRGAPPAAAMASLRSVQLSWVAPDASQTRRVGELGAVKNLSLADRFCIALAEARNEPLLTADRDWRHAPIQVPVEYIR